MASSASSHMVPWPRHIIEAVRQCTEQWVANTASLKDWDLLGELFLAAGRERDFLLVLARKITEAEARPTPDTSTARDSAMTIPEVYWKAIELYEKARPVRIREIDSLVMQMITLPDSILSKTNKIDALWRLRTAAELFETEPVVAMRAARIADTLFAGLNDQERRLDWYTPAAGWAISNSIFLHFPELMDSLRGSTAAYVNLVRAYNDVLFKGADPMRSSPLAIGATSPRIEGDFWFPDRPSMPRPTVGKRSLVVPLPDCRGGWASEFAGFQDGGCLRRFAMLQRVHRQFPDVEINLVTYQEGRAILQEPASAADEAEDMRRWLLEYFQLPVTLVVNEADFVHLPDPDSRWINTKWTLEPMLNWGCLVVANGGRMVCGNAYLVDESGLLLGTFPLRFPPDVGERQLVRMLEAIAHRKP